jgi:hypothetical protein
MLKCEYWHGLIFELMLAQGISSIKPCSSVNVYSIVTGRKFTLLCAERCSYFIVLMLYKCDIELYLVSGPSYTLDTACSSSMTAMEHAYRAMRDGLCVSAIVGGSSLSLHPYISLHLFRMGVLSRQGICRAFDRDGMHLSSVRCDMYILIVMNLV